MTARLLAALGIALSGCATAPAYTWRHDGLAMDYYRWVKVPREEFPARCGWVAPDGFQQGGACAVRLANGRIAPGDRRLTTDEPDGATFYGRLCVVFGTMDLEEAARMRDLDGESTLAEHELRHCRGEVHG